ncbi:MAG: CoA ester lyase [Hyphomicrobiaceae bacterium]
MTSPRERLRRTMLLTPGSARDRLAKAAASDADCIVFDLEDGVAPDRKAAARSFVAEALETLDFGRRERLVRINAVGSDAYALDLAALPLAALDALFVPKVESAAEIEALAHWLDGEERRLGLERRLALVATIETARGLFAGLAIADASDRLAALFFGSGDYTAQTGAAISERGLAVPRALVVAAAGAARLQAIDAAYFLAVKDAEATRQDALIAREMGFSGKVVFHPGQIGVCNDVFTPTADEIAQAERVVAAHAQAVARGEGVAYVDGQFLAIDIVAMAERTLAKAKAAGRIV